MISARIVADSINPAGCRLTTIECVVPKWMLGQVDKHGMVRNVAESSRAKPTSGVIAQVRNDPYLPDVWRYRAAEGGMQPGGIMTSVDSDEMDRLDLRARRYMLRIAERMNRLKPAKEDVNRRLEAWSWCSVVLTATEWDNYLTQRDHMNAQGPHATLGRLIREGLAASTPRPVGPGRSYNSWHLPYVQAAEMVTVPATSVPLISAARCGRVSYGRQGEVRSLDVDLDRAFSFIENHHWSPLDIPAIAMADDAWYGPLQGWRSLRKHYAGESGSAQHGCQTDIAPWAVRRPA